MRITIFIGGVSGGGAERVMCNLANYLSNKGHNIDILTMSDESATYKLLDSINRIPLLVKQQRKSSLYNLYIRIKLLRRYMKRTNVDCYIVVSPVIILLTLFLRRYTKAKIIATERTNPSYYKPKWMQIMSRIVAKKVNGWVFQTHEAELWYKDVIKNSKIQIIPNAINDDFIVPKYLKEKKKYIVSVGRLVNAKNQIMLIAAFAKVVIKFPDYKLIIYGEGPNRKKLEYFINDLHLQNKVCLPGYSNDIVCKMQESMLFVFSSNYEGMPNALIEAMSLGLPCISTDCDGGGARFLIDNMKNGILIPKNDINQMAEAMVMLLSDTILANKLGCEARKIRNKLSAEVIYSEWENFIYEVVR